MIKSFLSGLVLILAANSASAVDVATYNIRSKIYLDNQLISSPHMIARENQKISLNLADKTTKQSLKIALVANNESKASRNAPIKLSYDMVYSDGKKSLHVEPVVVVDPHQKGAIKFKTASGHTVEMRVIAVRA